MKAYTYYIDPGHGWLEVDRSETIGLDISGYSYQSGDKVYLEEDCDMTLFLKSKNITRGQLIQEYSDNDSFIRGLDSYRA